eukprot:CAMPEP_0181488444 /NCGR_PEP_ID=MMETSP1110-20121109/48401_1 /TAXON_ID=174948 /ORGANISM="Symbiodinium sp., Strain CCMP421" /LENGTH=67 /DNA_ID=CAMNT_0023615109 /DNA_START=17 /DNA_END=217 /DNA_ORIENTATION=+
MSGMDKNTGMQEPGIWGDLRHQGHSRSIWGMASTDTTVTDKPMWMGTGNGENVTANGQEKPKYPFFN